MIVQIIKEVPDDIFNRCVDEVHEIDWNNIRDHRKQGVFETSTSIHLRSHNTNDYEEKPDSIETFSKITECKSNFDLIFKFLGNYNAAKWIKEEVNGIQIGRIMIVHLAPGGEIKIHKDPGLYFEKYSRYHIPLLTNEQVQFFNENGSRAHMPYKTLCRLNNLGFHGLINDSNEGRVHLIVDIEVDGGNSLF
jgi:hypothetical protein